MEGVYQVKTQKLTSLSVEQIVDCDGFAEDKDHADCGVYGNQSRITNQLIITINSRYILKVDGHIWYLNTSRAR